MIRTLAILAATAGVTACVGAPPPPTEPTSATPSTLDPAEQAAVDAVADEAARYANARGWTAVPADEVAAARRRNPRSLRAGLGARALLIAGDRVFRVPVESTAADPTEPPAVPAATGASARTGSVAQHVIVGSDDRDPVTSASAISGSYYRMVGRLFLRAIIGDGGSCTGTLVGPRHVLTSGHCFNAFTDRATFRPGISGPIAPSMTVNSTTFFVMGDGDTDDLALITLPDSSALANIGHLRMASVATSEEGDLVRIAGYPGDSQFCFTNPLPPSAPYCGGYLYTVRCGIEEVDQEVEYDCDTTPGMSGAAVTMVRNNERTVVAVHKGEDDDALDDGNRGVRLTYFNRVMLCSQINAARSAFDSFTCTP